MPLALVPVLARVAGLCDLLGFDIWEPEDLRVLGVRGGITRFTSQDPASPLVEVMRVPEIVPEHNPGRCVK
jgi:hypothetical protein